MEIRQKIAKSLGTKQKKAWKTVKSKYGVNDADLMEFCAAIDFTEFIVSYCGTTLTIRVYTNGMITER